MGAMDNLVKGAAGQAIQNMNIMFGFEEKEGITVDANCFIGGIKMKIIDDGTVTLPKGFYGAGDHVGIKKEKKDLALIYSEVDALAVGTFTQNVVKAAPVLWDKMVVENYDSARVIAINSGVANACTGDEGIYNNELFASKVADNFGVKKEEVLFVQLVLLENNYQWIR